MYGNGPRYDRLVVSARADGGGLPGAGTHTVEAELDAHEGKGWWTTMDLTEVPTAHCLLPTCLLTCCLLPTTDCLLPTVPLALATGHWPIATLTAQYSPLAAATQAELTASAGLHRIEADTLEAEYAGAHLPVTSN